MTCFVDLLALVGASYGRPGCFIANALKGPKVPESKLQGSKRGGFGFRGSGLGAVASLPTHVPGSGEPAKNVLNKEEGSSVSFVLSHRKTLSHNPLG